MPDRDARARLLARRQRAAGQAIAAEAVFHQARVLLLIVAFSGRTRGLRSLARLSRLDFLLRFPPILEFMNIDGHPTWPPSAATVPAERHATDIAFAGSRYGPWTDRYTLIIGALLGKQLIREVPGRTLEVIATSAGRAAATELAAATEWTRTKDRAEFLHQQLDITAARLDQLLRPAIRRMEKDLLKDNA
ncbi:hypothetical protein AB0M02_17860 [Actinoplanes sp. NPDC051861]|uniref:hypothetical protein n=1 Tax=Actinoplanes sp. NPDC051861 TaxID=3155170 RepID=UPI00342F617F